MSAKKWVYLFTEGDARMRDLLGGKGAGLAEMTKIGLPVPSGFTITTEARNAYYASGERFPEGLWPQVLEALSVIEEKTGKRFGDPLIPLLLSVRSGAKFSMPGMMDTVLNLGLNEATLSSLIQLTGNERFALDSFRRFLQMFGKVVLKVDTSHFEKVLERWKRKKRAQADTDLSAEHLRGIVAEFQEVVAKETGERFPQDPLKQLEMAIEAVFASWNSRRAVDYRNFHKIPHNLGTAVNIQAMVFGNLGPDSGSGVAFSRDPGTGERVLYGEYLVNAQGEDVVAGSRTPKKIAQLEEEMPQVYEQLAEIAGRLERHYQDVQDLEFTVERGRLYILQTRAAQRTALAAVRIAVDMVGEELISKEKALQRLEPNEVSHILLPYFDEGAKEKARQERKLLAVGLNASPGAARGKAIFDADRAKKLGEAGVAVILVRPETSADDVHGMLVARGILTARGGVTSHAALVARGRGKPCVAGCEALEIDLKARQFLVDERVVLEGEEISIDGFTGEVFLGGIPTLERRLAEVEELGTFLSWADEKRRLGVWANADYPLDAAKAMEFGAEGIGLCRTEHMFFEKERLPLVQRMILAAPEATALEREVERLEEEREKASLERRAELEKRMARAEKRRDASRAVKDYHHCLSRLLHFQKEDFKGIFQVVGDKPVVIRLLDPPLHEFLPSYEELLQETTELRCRGDNPSLLKEKEDLLKAVDAMRERNPMLGLRGCRLGLLFGAINEMQVRAILTAAAELMKEGLKVHPEIMIPLVGHVNEIKVVREQLERVAQKVAEEVGFAIPYKFGTMIEVPRAALTAHEIAQYAEFFSFGTNDLTQTTFGFSRDDAEGKFLREYLERKILAENPFQVLDRSGVGKLIEMAATLGRETRPDLVLGICGEHGGDPSSIAFCHRVGLDYVSCSPFRVPVARLAAAQAALAEVERDR